MKTCILDGCEKPPKGQGYCAAHYDRLRRNGDVQAHIPVRVLFAGDPKPGHLWCRICELEKPDEEMMSAAYTRANRWRTGVCKSCKKGRNTTPEARRKSHLKTAYQLSPEEYEKLLDSQDGVCAICKRPPKSRRLAVDHDHSCCPGKSTCGECVRGLLCVSCNLRVEWWLTFRGEVAAYLT
jgi:Recombination endonuclease VII